MFPFFPMCYPEIMNVDTAANQTDFFKRERQNLKEEVSKHYWKKFWVPPPPSTLPQLQTTSDLRHNELLKEMGFDISPTNSSSNSTVSPATATIVDEKQYDLNSCLFHPCNLELFQALSNMEWYVKCPFSRECGVFAHRTMQNAYMSVLNRRVHDTYRKLGSNPEQCKFLFCFVFNRLLFFPSL